MAQSFSFNEMFNNYESAISGSGSRESVEIENSGEGTQIEILEDNMTNNSNGNTTSTMPTPRNTTSHADPLISGHVGALLIYVGSATSLFAVLVVLATYITSGQLRIKRLHMINFNLCIAFFILYIGIITSTIQTRIRVSETGCTAGSILIIYGIFLIWTWLAVHWCYLAVVAFKASTAHISNFFIKLALPANAIATLVVMIMVLIKVAKQEQISNPIRCFIEFDNITLTLVSFYISTCLVINVHCCIFCTARVTCSKPKNVVASKTKRIVLGIKRLGAISTAVLVCTGTTLALHTVLPIEELISGIVSSVLGLCILTGLVFRSQEFCIHWKAVLQGKNPTREQSLHRVMSRVQGGYLQQGTSPRKYTNDAHVSEERVEYNSSPKMIPRDDVSEANDGVFSILGNSSLKESNNANGSISVDKTKRWSENIVSTSSLRRNLFRTSIRKIHRLTSLGSNNVAPIQVDTPFIKGIDAVCRNKSEKLVLNMGQTTCIMIKDLNDEAQRPN